MYVHTYICITHQKILEWNNTKNTTNKSELLILIGFVYASMDLCLE